MTRITVIDKDSGKVVWEEEHSQENVGRVINELMEETFNPDYFRFEEKEV